MGSFLFNLAPQSKISLIAPSSWLDVERLNSGIEILSNWGFEPQFDQKIMTRMKRYCAGTIEDRISELLTALKDDSTVAIWAAKGGYGAMQIAPFLKIDDIHSAAKPLIGFSDITVLHSLWHKAGVFSCYGPNITTLTYTEQNSLAQLRTLLTSGKMPNTIKGTGGNGPCISGHLVGGNLSLIAALCGTPYQFNQTSDAILFLEDIDERPYKLDRMLTQLEQSGFFNCTNGIILGEFIGCNPELSDGTGYEGQQVLIDFFTQKKIPIVWGVGFGHGTRITPLVYGGYAQLDPERALISFI